MYLNALKKIKSLLNVLNTSKVIPGSTTGRISQLDEKNKDVRPYESIPSPLKLPFVGNSYFLFNETYRTSMHILMHNLAKKHGPLYRVDILGWEFLVICDPADFTEFFRQDAEFPKMPSLTLAVGDYKLKRKDMWPSGLRGLIGADGHEWWNFRQLVQTHTMRPGAISPYIPVLEDIAKEFVVLLHDKLDNMKETPSYTERLFKRYSLESIACVVLNQRLNCLDPKPGSREELFIESVTTIIKHFLTMRNLNPIWNRFPYLRFYKEFDRAFETTYKICSDHIDKAKTGILL